MKEREPMEEQLRLFLTLWRESNAIYEEWAKTRGLSLNGILVLYSFYDGKEGCTQKEISQKWTIPKQTVNTILNDFEKQGYIERLPMAEDRRNKLVRLTEKGRQFSDQVIAGLNSREMRAVEKMGIRRMESLNENMALFIRWFCEGGEENV